MSEVAVNNHPKESDVSGASHASPEVDLEHTDNSLNTLQGQVHLPVTVDFGLLKTGEEDCAIRISLKNPHEEQAELVGDLLICESNTTLDVTFIARTADYTEQLGIYALDYQNVFSDVERKAVLQPLDIKTELRAENVRELLNRLYAIESFDQEYYATDDVASRKNAQRCFQQLFRATALSADPDTFIETTALGNLSIRQVPTPNPVTLEKDQEPV